MTAMSPQIVGILTGGIGGAVLLGLFAVLMKASGQQGLTSMPFLIVVGATVLAVGLAWAFISSYIGAAGSAGISPDGASSLLGPINGHGVLLGIAAGLTWSLAMVLIKVALDHYATPVSILTPIFNTNTLVAVVLGLWVFAEWQDVKLPPLLIGSVLIVIGGVLVSSATQSR